MKKICGILLFVFVATFAFADTATVQFVNNPWGLAGPYLFNVTPTSPTPGPTEQKFLICWSDENFITKGETWTANVYTPGALPISTGLFPETMDQYEQIAYLAKELLQNPGNIAIQDAIWYAAGLFNGNPLSVTAQGFYDDAVANANAGSLAGTLFYLPVTQDSRNVPQPLVGFVPEPGSLMLLGTGILGAAGAVRRRFMV